MHDYFDFSLSSLKSSKDILTKLAPKCNTVDLLLFTNCFDFYTVEFIPYIYYYYLCFVSNKQSDYAILILFYFLIHVKTLTFQLKRKSK